MDSSTRHICIQPHNQIVNYLVITGTVAVFSLLVVLLLTSLLINPVCYVIESMLDGIVFHGFLTLKKNAIFQITIIHTYVYHHTILQLCMTDMVMFVQKTQSGKLCFVDQQLEKLYTFYCDYKCTQILKLYKIFVLSCTQETVQLCNQHCQQLERFVTHAHRHTVQLNYFKHACGYTRVATHLMRAEAQNSV